MWKGIVGLVVVNIIDKFFIGLYKIMVMEGNDVKEEVGSIEKKIVCVFLMILYFIEEYLIMNFEDEFLFIKYMYKEEYFLKINKF